MASDIVERLRYLHARNMSTDDALMGEAAAEILRLRAALTIARAEGRRAGMTP